jgi:hypothetical protein
MPRRLSDRRRSVVSFRRIASAALALAVLRCGTAAALDPPRRLASLRLPGDAAILSMAAHGDTLLLGRRDSAGDELVAVDASDPLDPRIAWSSDVGADVDGIDTTGDLALLATGHPDAELVALDLGTRSPRGTFDVPGARHGIVVQVVLEAPLVVWIGVTDDVVEREAYLVNVADLAAPAVLASRDAIGPLRTPPPPDPVEKGYVAGGDVVARAKGLTRPDFTFLAVNGASPELQVVSGLDDQVSIPDTNGDGVRRLACLGDSTTFPFLDKNPGSWCQYLQQTVWSGTVRIRNYGFLGARMTPAPTAEAFTQLAAALEDGADVAIANFGLNDILSFTPSEIVDAAHALATAANAAGVPLLLATPTPRYDVDGVDLAQELADVSALMRASFPGDQVLDFNAVVGEDDLGPDRLHTGPTAVLAEGTLARAYVVSPDPRRFGDRCTTRTPAQRARLKVSRLDAHPGYEPVTISGVVRFPSAVAVDPTTTGTQVTIVGATGAILLQLDVPPGAFAGGAGWSANRRGTAFTYRRTPPDVGADRVVIAGRRDAPGAYAIRVHARAVDVPVTPADLPLRAWVLVGSAGGECASMEFPGRRGSRCTLGRRALACR